VTLHRARGESFVDHLVRVAEGLAVARDGTPFRLDANRAWVRRVWLAITGCKVWPIPERAVQPDELCDACRAQIGQLREWSWSIEGVADATLDAEGEPVWTVRAEHAADCVGVGLYPQTFCWLNLPRQEGKTFQAGVLCNVLGLVLEDFRASFLSNSEDQSEALWNENFAPFVERNRDDLDGIAEIGRTSIRYRETLFGAESSAAIDFMTASGSSATGRTKRDLIVVDECRDIEPSLVTKVTPAITSTKGLRCPHGHVRHLWTGRVLPSDCGACGARLVPSWGRLLLMSSAGMRTGGDRDWFADGLDALAEEPSRYAWVHATHESRNPIVSQTTRTAISEVFGRIPQMRLAVDVEVHNRAVSAGADFVAMRHVERASVARQREGSALPCVAFLDASAVDELTTLVVLEDAGLDVGEDPWTHLRQVRLDIWAPNPRRLVRPEADREHLRSVGQQVDEVLVWDHLEVLLPRFPGLAALGVDTRGIAWAGRLVTRAQRSGQRWGHVVASVRRHEHERDVAFADLESRVVARGESRGGHPARVRSIELIESAQLAAEFKGARKRRANDGTSRVTDASRHLRHLDVVDALAMACLEAHKLALKPRGGSLADVARAESKQGALLRRLLPLTPRMGVGGGFDG
jgi:hypothetical protein